MRAAITEGDWTARRKGRSSHLGWCRYTSRARSRSAASTVCRRHSTRTDHHCKCARAPSGCSSARALGVRFRFHSTPNLSDITRTSKSAADRCFTLRRLDKSCCRAKESNVTPSHHRLQASTANRTTRLTSWSLPQSTTRLDA
jgi:hypothetical protein